MNRLPHILPEPNAVLRQARSLWRAPAFRQSLLAAAAVWLVMILFCALPLRGGRPLVDTTAGASRVACRMLDAVGVLHAASRNGLDISQAVTECRGDRILSLGWSTAVALLLTLAWATSRQLPWRHVVVISVPTIPLVWLANVLTLFLALVTGAVLQLDLTSPLLERGFAVLGLGLSLALQWSLIQVVGTLIVWWRYQRAVRSAADTHGLPPSPTERRRRPQAILTAVAVGVLGPWLVGSAQTVQSQITIYRDAAETSLNTGDRSAARVAMTRLMQLDAHAPAHRFLQAKGLAADGDLDAAEKIVRELVAAEGREFAPAHRWLADHVSRRRTEPGQRSASPDNEFVGHLTKVAALTPGDVNAHLALAETYLTRRSPEHAIRELEQVVDQRPDLRLTLARLCIIAGHADTARLHGELAREYFKAELESYPLAVGPRLGLTASLLFLEDFPQATAVLLKGWQQSDDDVYTQALGTAYRAWQDALARKGAAASERLALLEKSLSYAPGHPETLQRVAVLATEERGSGPAIDLLTKSLAERDIPASVHFILGTNAYRHGRVENARRHLEEAHRLDPQHVETLNNLAIVLSEFDAPLLERARALADDAVRRRPDIASIRETRGQILAKLGLWSLAIADLENALQVMRHNPKIHATLAEAYLHLGDRGLAAEHRRLAGGKAELSSEPPRPAR